VEIVSKSGISQKRETHIGNNMKQTTTISFIIPTYNEELFLPKVLSSIKQLVSNIVYEIIVVDNGSTDATTRIAQECGAKVIVDSSKTIAGLRNLGARYAVGKVLVFLDGDVIITHEWVENIFKVVTSIEHNNQIITGSRYGIVTNPGWIEKHWFLPMTHEKARYINGGHLIVDRDVFNEIGGFTDSLITGEDWEFCMRAKQKGMVIFNNPDLRVIHEGYPKNLRQFIRREKWLGIQDFYNISTFLKSRPAIFASLYWFSGILGIFLFLYYKSVIYIIIAFIINSIFCIFATLNKKTQFPLNVIYYFLLYHVYFFARGLSLIDSLLQKHTRSGK